MDKLRNKFTIHGIEFVYIYLIGIFAAFLGWCAENVVRLISLGVIDNRFHFLPFIFPYALAVIAMFLALGTPENLCFFGHELFRTKTLKNKILSHLSYFLIVSFFVFVGELAVGNFYYYATGLDLWNYSNLPLGVTKYAGLIPSFGYGLGAYLLMVFFNKMLKLVSKVPFGIAFGICITLGLAILVDNIYMISYTLVNKKKPEYWSWQVYTKASLDVIQTYFSCIKISLLKI